MSETSELVEAAIVRHHAGDPLALNDMFQRSGERIRTIAHRMLHGQFGRIAALEQTDDITQEAALRLLKAMREVPVGSAVEFFRFSACMMRRVLMDLGRHHFNPDGSAAHRADVPLGGNTSGPGFVPRDNRTSAPDQLAAWNEFLERVETLPDEQLAVFDLLWCQDLEQEEAAKLLGVSVPTVKRRWRDAKLSLIELLGDNLPGDL